MGRDEHYETSWSRSGLFVVTLSGVAAPLAFLPPLDKEDSTLRATLQLSRSSFLRRNRETRWVCEQCCSNPATTVGPNFFSDRKRWLVASMLDAVEAEDVAVDRKGISLSPETTCALRRKMNSSRALGPKDVGRGGRVAPLQEAAGRAEWAEIEESLGFGRRSECCSLSASGWSRWDTRRTHTKWESLSGSRWQSVKCSAASRCRQSRFDRKRITVLGRCSLWPKKALDKAPSVALGPWSGSERCRTKRDSSTSKKQSRSAARRG